MTKYKNDQKDDSKYTDNKKQDSKYKGKDKKKEDTQEKEETKKFKCSIKSLKKLSEKYDEAECLKDSAVESAQTQITNAAEQLEYISELVKIQNELEEKISLWLKNCNCKCTTEMSEYKCSKLMKKFIKVDAEEKELYEQIVEALSELIALLEKVEKVDAIKDELLKMLEENCFPKKKHGNK